MSSPARCDLHMHSTMSDGTVPPDQLARRVAEAGIRLAALTDHDTLAGVAAFHREAAQLGVRVVPGVELSTCLPDGVALHLLGYFGFSPDTPESSLPLAAPLAEVREARDRRNQGIIARLQGLGVDITLAEVEALAAAQAATQTGDRRDRSVGRPHIAQVLMNKGVVTSIQDAFDRLLARGKPAHVPRARLEVERGIELLAASGGVGVVAHPIHLGYDEPKVRRTLGELRDRGLVGVEVRHTDHDPATQALYRRVARDLGLIETGGSDYHGEHKPGVALGVGKGDLELPVGLADELLARLGPGPVAA
jgi:predicted metal-dependent phosphoesterase TrpH